MSFAGIILAAGRAARMGGQAKQLAELKGKALIAHAAQAALDARLSPIVVVLGHEDGAVRAALARDVGADKRLVLVHAEKHAEGMAESLKAGVAALPEAIDGVFVLLADMPFVSADLIGQVAAGFDPAKLAAAPAYNGRRGNPVLLAPRAFALIEALTGDRGLGPMLNQRTDDIILVPVDDDGCLRDIDTPQALIEARAQSPSAPSGTVSPGD